MVVSISEIASSPIVVSISDIASSPIVVGTKISSSNGKIVFCTLQHQWQPAPPPSPPPTPIVLCLESRYSSKQKKFSYRWRSLRQLGPMNRYCSPALSFTSSLLYMSSLSEIRTHLQQTGPMGVAPPPPTISWSIPHLNGWKKGRERTLHLCR